MARNRAKRNATGRRQRPQNETRDLFVTKLSRRLVNPPPVKNDLVCTHRGEVRVVWHSTTTPIAGTLTTLALVNALPGSSVTWDRVQFHKFDIFSAFNMNYTGGNHPVGTALPLSVSLLDPLNVTTGNNDAPTFYNDGVGTFRRGHVGFQPNLMYRQSWIPTADTNPILSITTIPYEFTTPDYFFQIILQYTCVLRSVSGSPAPQRTFSVQRNDITSLSGAPIICLDQTSFDKFGGLYTTIHPATEQTKV